MGSPRISVIVPTYNSQETIETCLKSIKEQTYSPLEVIVVDEYSKDKTVEIACRYTEGKVYSYGPERSAKRNFGAKKAEGRCLFFVDSDMELTPNVVEECVNKVERSKAGAVIIPEISAGEGFWAKCRILERSCYIGDEVIEAARFFNREIFWKVGGYDEKMVGAEDWDLHQRVIDSGFEIARIESQIKHHEGRLQLRSLMKKKYSYSRAFRHYYQRHPHTAKKQFTPFRRAYFRNWKRFAKDPIHTLGFIILKSAEATAAISGIMLHREG